MTDLAQTLAIILLAFVTFNNESKVSKHKRQFIEIQGSMANLIRKISDKL